MVSISDALPLEAARHLVLMMHQRIRIKFKYDRAYTLDTDLQPRNCTSLLD